jgi:uncharacterized membrane protein
MICRLIFGHLLTNGLLMLTKHERMVTGTFWILVLAALLIVSVGYLTNSPKLVIATLSCGMTAMLVALVARTEAKPKQIMIVLWTILALLGIGMAFLAFTKRLP